MADYDGGITLLPTKHTIEELEDKLKLVVWDWEVDGDEAQSKANLETHKAAYAIYQALRRDDGGLDVSRPGQPKWDRNKLIELCDLWNKYSNEKMKEFYDFPRL
tara:strand:- start:3424 stop:3735 length:312 start_codon:yes stop_codon:yes gene_type:complete